ncbi:hypothetical protein C8F01DRAFT_217654 [Mycena amicta]|nr:hypothetical protein C8F01DRAFT_217654 [Mycena amicta]
MHATTTLLSLLFVAGSVLAAPLHSRAVSPIACTNTTGTSGIGAALRGLEITLVEINPLESIVDPAPIFSAQLNVLTALSINAQLESLALFPTIPPSNPPAATALSDLSTSLSTIQAFVANITVEGGASQDITDSNTANVAKATKLIDQAVGFSSPEAIGCSVVN